MRELYTADRRSVARSQNRLPNHDKCVFDSKIGEYGQMAIAIGSQCATKMYLLPCYGCACHNMHARMQY